MPRAPTKGHRSAAKMADYFFYLRSDRLGIGSIAGKYFD